LRFIFFLNKYRLTEGDRNHSEVVVSVSSSRTLFVSKSSNIETAPKVQLFEVEGKDVQKLKVKTVCQSSPSLPLSLSSFNCPSFQLRILFDCEPRRQAATESCSFPLITPRLFTFTNVLGSIGSGVVYVPSHLPPVRLPTIVNVYGGPSVQLVRNDFSANNAQFSMWAALGFCVVRIDNVGSGHRGQKFERATYLTMGEHECADQAAALKTLIESGLVDANRIGVFGTSYGGYMSLMLLAKLPSLYRVAVSCAPVVQGEAYDTGYTERYLKLPASNSAGYKRSSVLTYVQNLPREQGRLVIVHGLKDENGELFTRREKEREREME
jgi:dipeptidyl aminopeptidase/acylaminoacyl peptidase